MSDSGAVRGRSLAFMSRVPIAEHHWVRPMFSQHAFLEVSLERGVRIEIDRAGYRIRSACQIHRIAKIGAEDV